MKFLNKLFTQVIFSEASELNLVATDMGEQQIGGISFEDEPVARLKTATGTIGSLGIFVSATAKVSVLKTSPMADNYWKRILSNAYIGGTCTLYDDTNRAYEISDVSINISEIAPMNGTEPAVEYTIQGNLWVNKDSIGEINAN